MGTPTEQQNEARPLLVEFCIWPTNRFGKKDVEHSATNTAIKGNVVLKCKTQPTRIRFKPCSKMDLLWDRGNE